MTTKDTPMTTQTYVAKITVPTPTATTLWMRGFLPWQLWRFVWLNLKMLRMISLSHPTRRDPSAPKAP